jgi:hypothetical protein
MPENEYVLIDYKMLPLVLDNCTVPAQGNRKLSIAIVVYLVLN